MASEEYRAFAESEEVQAATLQVMRGWIYLASLRSWPNSKTPTSGEKLSRN
jgi:hypothetical protein